MTSSANLVDGNEREFTMFTTSTVDRCISTEPTSSRSFRPAMEPRFHDGRCRDYCCNGRCRDYCCTDRCRGDYCSRWTM